MDTRLKDKEKEKEKDMAPGERTPKPGLGAPDLMKDLSVAACYCDSLWNRLDLIWTVVKERHCEDSSHGKMCGEWVIIDKCEVLIAYCANCELMID
ncbi:hypothetical protein Bca4012_077942 [Brassica carinata]